MARPAGGRRVGLRLRGALQGVGLRPWAHREARALGLAGFVRNHPDGVGIELEGDGEAIEAWLAALRERPPAGARLEDVERRELAPLAETGFRILASRREAAATGRMPLDEPVCGACLAELFDPGDRRHRYAFTHCAACGPRASVIRALPFDRERTSLAGFPPCPACAREYASPEDRRFHAETLACPACGPRLVARTPAGDPVAGDPVEAAAARLAAGAIVAVKGYGGFHLAVDARSSQAVARLRKRKRRPTRPFALLVPDLAGARELARLAARDEATLAGSERPVLLAPRRDEACAAWGLAPEVWGASGDLGLMLPVAPVHWLLLFAPGARPGRDAPRLPALVFTSANRSGEPTEWDDAGARQRLGEVADLFLEHDRAVAGPSDDPVLRSAEGGAIPIRLSRGTAPRVFAMPAAGRDAPPGVALGGDLKCAPAVAAGDEIHLGGHIGDLASERAMDALAERALALGAGLGVAPRWVAHDLHPGYHGTAVARELAERLGCETIPVQHHHAHALACLTDADRPPPALALTLDGAGHGADGEVWGGELLWVEATRFERLAHLERVPLPGGDRAAREPWRMAAAWLARAFPDGAEPALAWHARRDPAALAVVERMLERGLNAPPTSSCGRLFDAAASLLDRCDRASFEGEAAMALEALAARAEATEANATRADPAPAWDAPGRPDGARPREIPARDLIAALVRERAAGASPAGCALRFHERLAARLADAARAAARECGASRGVPVALAGGCLQNRLLLGALRRRLTEAGLELVVQRRAPVGDGGLALGQAAVAAALRSRSAAGAQ